MEKIIPLKMFTLFVKNIWSYFLNWTLALIIVIILWSLLSGLPPQILADLDNTVVWIVLILLIFLKSSSVLPVAWRIKSTTVGFILQFFFFLSLFSFFLYQVKSFHLLFNLTWACWNSLVIHSFFLKLQFCFVLINVLNSSSIVHWMDTKLHFTNTYWVKKKWRMFFLTLWWNYLWWIMKFWLTLI